MRNAQPIIRPNATDTETVAIKSNFIATVDFERKSYTRLMKRPSRVSICSTSPISTNVGT